MDPRPDATTVKVALWPAETVWFAGCALIQRRVAAKLLAFHPKLIIGSVTTSASAKRYAMATLLAVLAIENKEPGNDQQRTYQGLIFFKGRP